MDNPFFWSNESDVRGLLYEQQETVEGIGLLDECEAERRRIHPILSQLLQYGRIESLRLGSISRMAVLKGGLLKNDLQYSLEKTYPRDFTDMLVRAKKYVRADEVFEGEPSIVLTEDKKEERPESLSKSQQHHHSTPRYQRFRTSLGNPWQRDNPRREQRVSPPRRFTNFTSLNAAQAQVLMEIRDRISRAEKLQFNPDQWNYNKYCLYHRDHSPYIEDCIQLWDEIEEPIRCGRLDQFIRCQ